MTIGTATVARTKVRRAIGRSFIALRSARFSSRRVGKTATQIMSASWCLDGGGTGARCGVGRWSDMAGELLGSDGPGEWRLAEAARQLGASGHVATADLSNSAVDVLLDEVCIQRNRCR